jgi:hypothetical protein
MTTVPLDMQRSEAAEASSGVKTTIMVTGAALIVCALWVAFFFDVVVPVAHMLRH